VPLSWCVLAKEECGFQAALPAVSSGVHDSMRDCGLTCGLHFVIAMIVIAGTGTSIPLPWLLLLSLLSVLFRDVKAGNVLVDAEGHVRLGDFGVAGGWRAQGAQRPPPGGGSGAQQQAVRQRAWP